jgi:23S rRNA (cytidine1920-2'-O)/16S rRNA (cytidine1409-2'-O)-methyltransferase
MKRVDLLLVEQGLATSRTAAQHLLESGRVSLNGQVISKASSKFPAGTPLEVGRTRPTALFHVAGRSWMPPCRRPGWISMAGGCWMWVSPPAALPIAAGRAEYVVGVDVGHDQLHPRLWDDPRVRCFEG